MITTLVTMALAMTAAKADAQDNARKAFNNCIIKTTIEHLEKSVSQSDFNTAIIAACPTEKVKYREFLVASEIRYGSKRSEAEKYADEELQMMVDVQTGAYGDYLKDKTRPGLEK